MHRALWAACLMALSFAPPAHGQTAADRPQRLLFMEKVMSGEMDKLDKQLLRDPKNATTRDLTNASLLILRTNGSPASAELLLRRVFSLQNMDRTSRDFGTIPWKIDDPSVKDANAIEFAMQALGAVYLGYGDHLSTGFKKDSQEHLRAALVALANHRVSVSYTNIFLMNTMNTIELAEYLGDDDALQRGYRQWQQWWSYTQQNGIHEFDSPTYYAVDLGDLDLGFLYVKDGAIHQQIQSALDMFWRDILSNYLLATGHLSGAHSRDYYPLTGRGGLECYLYMEGLFTPGKRRFADLFLEKVDLLESERPGGYRVSQDILDIAKTPERIVEQRWDADHSFIRYTFLTQDFAIGFATGKYGEQDKMFAADLTGHDPQNPPTSITLVPDVLDSPYGLVKTRDRSGHMKPTHLPLNLSGVQDKGLALLVADLDPATAVDSPTYATNLILPSNATRIMIDKDAVKVSPSLNLPLSDRSILGLREEQSCFVARIVSVDKLNGVAPSIALKADSLGLSNGALRLTIYHAQASFSNSDQRHLHVAMLVKAQSCKDDNDLSLAMAEIRNATVEVSKDPDAWQGVVHAGSSKLELQEDPTTRRPAVSKVNDRPVVSAVFNLNSRAMGLSDAH